MKKLTLPLFTACALFMSPGSAHPSAAPADIEAQTWRRFAAATVEIEPGEGRAPIIYDFVTGCAATRDSADAKVWRLIEGPAHGGSVSLGGVITQGNDNLQAIADSSSTTEGTCAGRIQQAYGADFTRDIARVGAIARHAIAVLKGQPIDGPESTVLPQNVEAVKEAQARAVKLIHSPVLLGVLNGGGQTVLILGEPFSPYRWLAQYASLPDGSWKFEGAFDVPYIR